MWFVAEAAGIAGACAGVAADSTGVDADADASFLGLNDADADIDDCAEGDGPVTMMTATKLTMMTKRYADSKDRENEEVYDDNDADFDAYYVWLRCPCHGDADDVHDDAHGKMHTDIYSARSANTHTHTRTQHNTQHTTINNTQHDASEVP